MARKLIKVTNFIEYEQPVDMMAEVPIQASPAWKENEKFRLVGKSTTRTDAYDIISGGAKYTTDIQLPGLLIMKILRCPHGAARIKNIDLSRAKKLKGVVYIMTHENAPDISWMRYGKLMDTHLRLQQLLPAVQMTVPFCFRRWLFRRDRFPYRQP